MCPELVSTWRTRAGAFRASGLADHAKLAETFADELEGFKPLKELIPLKEAVLRSGYTYQHLWRLVTTGELPNYGTRSAIRVLASELPRKPQRFIKKR